jgi:hypothetical protein
MADGFEVASISALADLATDLVEESPYPDKNCLRTAFASALVDKWHLVENQWCCEKVSVRASDIVEATLHVKGDLFVLFRISCQVIRRSI